MGSQLHRSLHVTVLDANQHRRTCNYWFVVTESHGPHTAFTSKEGFLRWLNERGLRIEEPLTEPGTWSTQCIIGEYFTASHMEPAVFDLLPAIAESRTLSNGDYVVAKITEENGIRTVHTLNPNAKRHVFDYWESSEMMDPGRKGPIPATA